MTKPAEAPCTDSARRVTPMKLLVRVVEARGLPAVHVDGSSDPFVKLQLGKRRAKMAVVKRSLAPAWDEEFSFLVGNVAEELVATVLNEDKYFSNDVLGRVRMPIARVMVTDELSLGTAWYQLEPKSKKSAKKCRGIIAVARFFDLIALFCFVLFLALLCQSIMAISFLQCCCC
jgi:Ca2+-dependent lipid-binding protein